MTWGMNGSQVHDEGLTAGRRLCRIRCSGGWR